MINYIWSQDTWKPQNRSRSDTVLLLMDILVNAYQIVKQVTRKPAAILLA